MKYLIFFVLLISVAFKASEGEDGGEDITEDPDEVTTPGGPALTELTTEGSKGEKLPESTPKPTKSKDKKNSKSKKDGKEGKKGDKDGKKDDKKDKKGEKPNEDLILGHFRLLSDPKAEDYNEFLKAMEYSKEDREKVRNSYGVQVDIEKGSKTDEYIYKIHWGFKTLTTKFIRDEEYDDKLFDGREYKAVVNMADNVITRNEKHKGFNVNHEAKFKKEGFEINSTAKNKTAHQIFERMEFFFNSNKFSEQMRKGFESFFG